MISQIEKGNAMPSFEIISKLAERLNCSITFLLEEVASETVSPPPSIPTQLVRAEQYLESNLLNEFLNIIKSIEITEEEADLKAQLNNKSKRTKK
ncbi:helix-turn-helix transcriptional regulator [Paenibacillus sp. FSL M8-0228]|uniref:helix-turn-helix domain-containing protein n=1 Tax=Paenibacillus TaxID=44249 RepID=UPI00114D1484|nr:MULTISPECIES: helix-turn-helix transcriptional regulator [Paenibacillus]MBO3287166.1 helix-turn-helix transcriptional regulator [Paenibacillus polymyxa]